MGKSFRVGSSEQTTPLQLAGPSWDYGDVTGEGVVVVAGGGEEAEWEWMRLWVVRSP